MTADRNFGPSPPYLAVLHIVQPMARRMTIFPHGETTPAGCLLASSAISCSPAAADVQRALAEIRLKIEGRLRNKIADDKTMLRLKPKPDADALAGHVMAVIQGMSTLARDGATTEKLLSVASAAMLAWPS